MKLVISSAALRAALDVASSAVPTRIATLPVLNHVLIEAHIDGGVCISGTDLETRAWHTVAARVDEAGSVTLPPERIRAFLDAISDDITLTVDSKHKAELVSGRTKIRLAGFDPEEMPVAPSFDAPAWDHTMPADVLLGAVKSVAHAVAPKDDHPVLAGTLIRVASGMLTLAAADGFRLAVRTLEIDAPDLSVIAQGKTLTQAAKALSGATSARLLVNADESSLLVDSEVGCWAIRLIEGQFPDFNRIVPQDTPIGVTVACADFLRALKIAEGVELGDLGHKAHLTITPDSIEIRASGADHQHEAEAIIDATVERGDGLTIAFRVAHLRDAVRSLTSASALLELTDPTRPGLIRSPDSRDVLQVFMPLAVARP